MVDTEFSALASTNTIASTDQLLIVRAGVAYRFSGSLPTVTSLGNVLIGRATELQPAFALHAEKPGLSPIYLVAGNANGNGALLGVNSALEIELLTYGTGPIVFGSFNVGNGRVEYGRYDSSGNLLPGTDNSFNLGLPSRRFAGVYVASGVISTSDEREKTWKGGLTPAHVSAARRIVAEIGLFQWNDAIAEKGENEARLHIGPRAQAVARIMVDEGLEEPFEDGSVPHFRHAFLCYDRWDETPARPAVDEVRGDDGEIVTPAQPAVAAIPAGDRFGLRVDQLTMFLLAALLGGAT